MNGRDQDAIVELLKEVLQIDESTALALTTSEDVVVKRQVSAIVNSYETLPQWEREMERSRERLRHAGV